MIKHFCDVCGAEIHDGNAAYTEGNVSLRSPDRVLPHELRVCITVSHKTEGPSLDLCSTCVFTAVSRLDPRPVAAEEYR